MKIKITGDPLTPVQKRLFDFIQRFYGKRGYMPSYKEMGKKFGITIPSVFETVQRLQKKGWVRRRWGQKRWMELE